jgi:hypothetical protein
MNRCVPVFVVVMLYCSSCRTDVPNSIEIGQDEYRVAGQITKIYSHWFLAGVQLTRPDVALTNGVELLPARDGEVFWDLRLRVLQQRDNYLIAEIVVNWSHHQIKEGDFACYLPQPRSGR